MTMTEQPELFTRRVRDICAQKHGGDENSRAAHRRLVEGGGLSRQRAEVLAAVRQAGVRGLTCSELAARWDVGLNRISGRFSELVRSGHLERQGRRKDGWVHVIAQES
jgi:hypothetical protein